MYTKSDRNGVIDKTVGKKGVLLARRDNCNFIRHVYREVTSKIFEKEPKEQILEFVIDEINKLCSGSYPHKNFVVSKSVGGIGDGNVVEFINEKGVRKGKIGDYTVPLLPTDKVLREKQLEKKEAVDEREFYAKCLPAQVQMAEKMRRRGQRVESGSRLEYVITDTGNSKSNQYDKIEHIDYFMKHKEVLKIDYMYYLKLLTLPLDQLLASVYKEEKEFVTNQYKFRSKIRAKVIEELKELFNPRIVMVK